MALGSRPLIGPTRSPVRREKCSREAQPWIWVEIIISDIPSQRRRMSRITSQDRVGSVPGQKLLNFFWKSSENNRRIAFLGAEGSAKATLLQTSQPGAQKMLKILIGLILVLLFFVVLFFNKLKEALSTGGMAILLAILVGLSGAAAWLGFADKGKTDTAAVPASKAALPGCRSPRADRHRPRRRDPRRPFEGDSGRGGRPERAGDLREGQPLRRRGLQPQ